ncbi:hypothetical protein QQS21_002072 [Conoideocrella luteorostrata]|uniref:Enolase n=1 Tax=Conoideocrella luteorostrata TaxID=1105319 RepID=A0AAJ0CW33_9HYPO|nr:hypothetical protein QQS21_002072 [Conoideocrella luteorostrata]
MNRVYSRDENRAESYLIDKVVLLRVMSTEAGRNVNSIQVLPIVQIQKNDGYEGFGYGESLVAGCGI